MTFEFPFDANRMAQKRLTLRSLPKNDLEKQAVLLQVLDEFVDNKTYDESEVNETLSKLFDDVALIRRELINFSYMQRDPRKGTYWVAKRTITVDEIRNNTRLYQHAQSYGIK